MHSIVVVRCKYYYIIFSNFKKIINQGNEEKHIILFVRVEQTSFSEWTIMELANSLKQAFGRNFLWSFIGFVCLLHTRFSHQCPKKACQAHHWVFQLRYQNIFIRANKQKNSVKVLTNSKLAAEVNLYSKYSLQPELVRMCVNGW